jgi:hypothetical protein
MQVLARPARCKTATILAKSALSRLCIQKQLLIVQLSQACVTSQRGGLLGDGLQQSGHVLNDLSIDPDVSGNLRLKDLSKLS